MPSETFTHHSVARVPIARAFRALHRLETWREIGGVTSVTNAIFDEKGLAGYDFTVTAGGRDHLGQARRLEVDYERRIVMGVNSEQLLGKITVVLDPLDEQTQVDMNMEMTSRGFLAGMLFRVISGSVASNFADVAERFVASLAMSPDPTDS